MRLTIELDDSALRRIQKITGEKKKSPAVSRALAEFLKERERKRFMQKVMSGQTDYSRTNEELEALDVYETRG